MRAERDLGTGNWIWEFGNRFLSEEKFSEQRYSGKPDGVAEAEPERPKKKSTDNCQQTTDFGPISLRNSEIKNFRILTKNKRPKMKILNKKI